jgi:D-lactate dehydrogenase
MKISFFSTQPYDRTYFERFKGELQIRFLEPQLDETTVNLAQGSHAVCVFVNDRLNAEVLEQLASMQIQLVALRCAGFNNVDIEAAKRLHITVVRVPAYSPYAVAEHALALMLTLNRKTHKAYNRVREGNFSLDRLTGFDMHGKTVGVVGTGKIGQVMCAILLGLGCRVLAFDLVAHAPTEALGVTYVPLIDLLEQSDIITLHCPLNEHTKHLINETSIARMKPGAMLINTSRGGLIDTRAAIHGLKSGQIGYLGLDVYEQEEKLFFHDLSENVIQDDRILRLLSFPNVLITAHQGFFTDEALTQIARVTIQNIQDFMAGKPGENQVN